MSDRKELIAIFKAETEDHLTKLDKGIVELEKNPRNLELLKELNREAHTLKGSARVFGYNEIQDIAHRIEDIFDKVGQKKLVFSLLITDRIFKGLDLIRSIVEKIGKEDRINVDVSGICRKLEECLQPQIMQKVTAEKKPQRPKEAPSEGEERPQIRKMRDERREIGDEEAKEGDAYHSDGAVVNRLSLTEEYIRVPLSRVNKLLNLVGETVIHKMKSSSKIAQAKRLSRLAREVQKKTSELGEKIKKKFALEDEGIAKLLSQCDADMQKLREDAVNLYDNVSNEAFHLDPVIDELQVRMKEIRMLSLSTIFDGFPRMVRDIASQEGKKINLEISGEDTELDKKVLEGVKTPLVHILRNCIDHGIEKPQERVALGKSMAGMIKICAFHEAGNVVIVIEDDGEGIDIELIKQTVLKKRLLSAEDLETMGEKEILNAVFMNGYSTSPIVTDVSGRGIGLDVAKRDIESLKGQIILDTKKNKGTKFTLLLPLTIAIIQVLLLKIEEMLFALPMASITESLKVKAADVSTIEGKMAIQVRGHTVPVVRLSEIFALPSTQRDGGQTARGGANEELPVVITTSLEKRVGFIVDEIIGEEEVFIKSLGAHLGKVKNVSGATILGTGEIVVILDAADLIVNSALNRPVVSGRRPVLKEKKEEKRILVVDDALSTRELEKSILETQGYFVDTAVDGLDALDRMTQSKYDLIVSDVKMPRMDGFEFCKTVKKNDEYKDIPVVIVTSLEKEEDKRRGIEVGAAAYIVKTAFEQTNLLDTIERLMG